MEEKGFCHLVSDIIASDVSIISQAMRVVNKKIASFANFLDFQFRMLYNALIERRWRK